MRSPGQSLTTESQEDQSLQARQMSDVRVAEEF